jgi:YegS/Rv2252/BmrU family lipid kinase
MRCLYVYNKLSGGNKEIQYHNKIVSTLKEIYDYVDLFEVDSGDILTKLSKENYDDVICSGGDGSITLLINKLIKFGFKGNIGYIPLGTANDFARKHNIPFNVSKALEVIKDKHVEQISIGKVNEDYFLYGLALGKASSVGYKVSKESKKTFSKFAYIIEGVKELFSFKKYQINLKFDSYNIEYKTPLVLVLDSKTIGGFRVNRGKANAYDVIVLKQNLLNGAIGLISIFLFGYKKTNTIFYDYFNLKSFEIETKNNQDWCLDGEKIVAKNIAVLANDSHIKLYKKVG